ncbi:MAG TPA: VWA domain-containing protein [Pyrinomonadaceae bacterium]
MRTLTRLLFASVCIAVMTIASRAQTQPASEQQSGQKVVVNAGEVLFDVVVRDKKGRAVYDLRPSDLEVYEDGVAQQVNSFHLVRRGDVTGGGDIAASNAAGTSRAKSQAAGPASSASERAEAGQRLSAVAIVFDRLTPDGRARASRAALGYVGEKNDLVGVFLTDLSLVTLQPYTNDMQSVRRAIEKAGASNPSHYNSNDEQARDVRKRLGNVIKQTGGNPQNAGAQMEKKLLELELWDLEINEEFQREQQGMATMHGLLKVASSLGVLPGRKAIILFSEGLIIPPSVASPFRALINAANRSNVSIYTVDAAGLRTESKTEETRKEITSRSNLRLIQEASNEESTLPMTRGLERNEDLLNLNPDSGLGQLADQTGGSYITDTNDIQTRLQKVDEDLHSYYMMSYSPQNQNYDGSYRKIEIKVKRPGLVVQSRKGYFAINGAFASPVLSYEVPALALLSRGARPDIFPVEAAAFNFPEAGAPGRAPIAVEAPMEAFSFHVDSQKRLYKTDFSIVVLLKDQSGQVVKKLSKQYQLSGVFDELEAARQGNVLFYQETNLPPGSYKFEAVAYDHLTGRASVRTGTLEVADGDESKLRLSSVHIIRTAERAPANAQAGNPFQVGDLLLYPNLGEAVHKEASKQLPFFFTVYLPSGSQTAPKLMIELRQKGKSLAQIPVELSAPDAAGRIQYVAGLPLENIPAGEYELKVTVADGTNTFTRSGFFSVEK